MPNNRFEESRKIRRRLVVEGDLLLASPTHFGGTDPTAVTDAPIARDAVSGQPILYGTTLAGLVRTALADRLVGPGEAEPPEVRRFFGDGGGDVYGEQSPFIVEDAVCDGHTPTDFRNGVTINPVRGVAEKGLLFDMELLRPGTGFPLHMELLLDGRDDKSLLSCLLTCLDALEKGEVLLGARNRKGFGCCEVREQRYPNAVSYRWRLWDFDMCARNGMLQWMAFGSKTPFVQGWPIAEPRCYKEARNILEGCAPGATIYEGNREAFTAKLRMSIPASVLIRSEGHDPGEADTAHLCVADVAGKSTPVLSGTSLGGVLRARALKVAVTLDRHGGKRACSLVRHLFGSAPGERQLRAGRVYVKECPIVGGKALRHTRVKIDRWTGGALEHLLFEEDAFFQGKTDIEIRASLPKEGRLKQAMVGLLLCVIKDLFTGDLPVGGEASIGRGRLVGESGTLTYEQKGEKPQCWVLKKGERGGFDVDGDTKGLDDLFIGALRKHLTDPAQEETCDGISNP